MPAGLRFRYVLPLQDVHAAIFFDSQGFHLKVLLKLSSGNQAGRRRLPASSTSGLITRTGSPAAKARIFSTTPE